MTIHALGASVDVDLGDAIELTEFTSAWSRCLTPPSGEDRAQIVGEPVGPQPTMTSLTQAITRSLIHSRRGELLMLHAGAVCNPRTGEAVAYAAPGGTGKTTLSHLLGARYGYLTDETVGVDPVTRLIHPYPKPLSLRTAEGGYPKSERGPDELGLVAAHHAPRLTTLVVLRRDPAALEPRCTRLDLFDAIMAVVPETSSLSHLEQPLHLLADLYAELGGFWLLEYAEAADIEHWVSERLGAP